jgi:hypothetical protein
MGSLFDLFLQIRNFKFAYSGFADSYSSVKLSDNQTVDGIQTDGIAVKPCPLHTNIYIHRYHWVTNVGE